jgi:hypothetical protein
VPSGIGLDGREVPSAGAAYAGYDKDQLILSQGLPSSLFALGIDFAKTPGSTVRVNRPSYANTTYTAASRKLTTGQSISTTPIAMQSEQTHLTLERYAGPYDSTNSRVAPIGIESFDANMGVFSTTSMAGQLLRRDFHRFLDAVMVELCNVGTSIYPEGMTADNDATAAGQFPVTVEQIYRMEQTMDEASLPTFPDGSRLLVLSPKQVKDLNFDPDFKMQSVHLPSYNLLSQNYVRSISKTHIFKSVTLQAPTNSSTVAVHRGLAIAPGALMGGMGRRPRVASSTDDNYGETSKAVWIADLAFGVADSRFVYSFRSA